MAIKDIIRKTLITLHIDATTNLRYDRLTNEILRKSLKPSSNCVDIGCHKGEILEQMLRYSPGGKHFAFEPLPDMYEALKNKYGDRARIYPYALSNRSDSNKTFNMVKNAPAYSGLKRRSYEDLSHVELEEISVEVRTLDEVIGEERVDFIKIDVEGGDYDVLRGAGKLLERCHPLIVFEFGKGGAEYYGVSHEDMYRLLVENHGYRLHTLEGFLKRQEPLTGDAFGETYNIGKEYYFVAEYDK